MMNLIERKQDIVSGKEDLEFLFGLDQFPVFMGVTNRSEEKDQFADMNFYISRSTGMVQLNPLLPLDIVYQAEHNPGSTGPSWDKHHRALALFINKYQARNVFEIGGSHGKLAKYSKELNSDISWTILEPNPVPVEGLDAHVIEGFYTEQTEIPANINMLVHSHTLEHFYDPESFFKAAHKLRPGTFMCFSVPALRRHLQQQFTNTINFEHTYLCTEEFIEYWLTRYGFNLLERVYYKEDHSIFYAAVRTGASVSEVELPNSYNENKQLMSEYTHYHRHLIENFNHQIHHHSGPVYLFGAHVFNQFLLNFGLASDKLVCILDNSLAKQGKRLYGTSLMVRGPESLQTADNPLVILRSGVFNKEIKEDILLNHNASAVFLE